MYCIAKMVMRQKELIHIIYGISAKAKQVDKQYFLIWIS